MRLHELRLHAIGPFVDEQVIDFERLGASGLFLLEGPTGAGKTTVLDAVTFALYGSVTGSAADAGRLASDFAAPGIAPRVRLELSVRGRRMRVTRTPEYQRPKRRGSGTIKERATAHLEVWQDGSWISRSARQDEIGQFVGEQLGLTREQFRQVVLLPQGEFAGFLRADDDGRRAVLVKLFGTQFYERLATALQRRAAQARAEVSQCEADLKAQIGAAWDASGKDPEDDEERPLTWEQQVADLESVQGVVAQRARAATREALDAARMEDAARSVAAEAREVAARVAERDGLRAELDGLLGERGEQQERELRIDRARRAQPVRPLVDLLEDARSRVAVTLRQLAGLGLAAHADAAATKAGELLEQAGAADRTVASLAHLVDLESGLQGQRVRLEAADGSLAADEARRDGLREDCARLPAELAAVAAGTAAAQGVADEAQRAEQALPQARRRAEAAASAAALEERLIALRAAERAARRRYDEARDHVAVVVEQRLAGLQGELAARLVSGEACLVCGSEEHPAPAAVGLSPIGEDVLREAEQARDHAWDACETAAGSVANVGSALAAARAVADGVCVDDAEALVAELGSRVAAGAPALLDVDRLRQQRTELEAALARARDALLACTARVATAQAEVQRRRDDLLAAEESVARQRDGHASVAARCAALATSAVVAAEGAAALVEHQGAHDAMDAAHAAALAGAVAAGFADLEQARGWVLCDEDLARLEEQVRVWQARLSTVRSRLSEERLRTVEGISGSQARDVAAAAEELHAQAAARSRESAQGATRAQHSEELFGRRVAAVRRAAQERAAVAAAADEVMAVDDYVRGNAGKPRMTLSTFVLRYWFEQVVAAANVRLQAMSSGKYQLLRVERGPRAASRVGLGLAVLDRHTGRERGTETLSGGETFYTSLALALGLADVVVAEAGGAQLDTLFIDEGFGSLDSATLDEVMTVIDELRGHGRVVGVVSHVAELNERIPERLSIRREREDGPSRLTVVA